MSLGIEGVTGEDSRRTMSWHRREEWDHAPLTTYADLARVDGHVRVPASVGPRFDVWGLGAE